jgi:tetratricopeptide (TPR) repeat protein
MNSGAFAYYLQSRERDYIVMQDIEPDHHQIAVHEYTHLIVRHAKMELPVWLNEGLADLYASLEQHGEQALVGRPLGMRVATLARQPWLDWNTVFAVTKDSPYYNQSEKMAIFYAQSWATTHMLALSPDYMPRFSQFLNTIASGTSTSESFQQIYGKSISQVGNDVRKYVERASVRGALYDVQLQLSGLETHVTPVSEFQVDLLLADLLVATKASEGQARRRLLALAARYPQAAEVEESLGYLEWEQENVPEARKHFALAADRGSKNARMLYDLASLEYKAGAPPQTVIDHLQKVIALQPQHAEARLSLAEIEAMQSHYGTALGIINPVHTVEPEQAFRLFSLLAFLHAELNDPEGAKIFGPRALPYAKAPSDRLRVEQLLQSLEAQTRPPTSRR